MTKKMNFSFGLAGAEKRTLLLALILCLVGLVFVFEASVAEAFQDFGNQFYFIRQQAMWFGVGLLSLIAGMFMPIKIWKKIIFYFLT